MSNVERLTRVTSFTNALPREAFERVACQSFGGAREALKMNPHAPLSALVDILEKHAFSEGYRTDRPSSAASAVNGL